MKIGIMHYRVGETDGVSLEIEKQIQVLTQKGFSVIRISGETKDVESSTLDGIAMNDPENLDTFHASFVDLGRLSPDELERKILKKAKLIQNELTTLIQQEQLDGLIIHNIWALGWNLPAAVGVAEAIKDTGIQGIGHNHDFFWERSQYEQPTTPFIRKIMEQYLPPSGPNFSHFVINQIAQNQLKTRKGIPSYVLPNVMDFQAPVWKRDGFSETIRPRLGIAPDDLVFLQATRILPRKGIEMAFDFIEDFRKVFATLDRSSGQPIFAGGPTLQKDSRIHFVLCGYAEQQDQDYLAFLQKKATNHSYPTHFCGDLVGQTRSANPVRYSLWDMYTMADIITYPSIQEGWGNQLLEAIFAQKLILGYEYPVFQTDIGPKGIRIVSLGSSAQIIQTNIHTVPKPDMQRAIQTLSDLLHNPASVQEWVSTNFTIGKKCFSLQVLGDALEKALSNKPQTRD